MFGKNDPIITDKDVGDFVKQLHNNERPQKDIITGVEDARMAKNSTESTIRTQNKN